MAPDKPRYIEPLYKPSELSEEEIAHRPKSLKTIIETMTLENFEDYDHNLRRKVSSDRYDLEKQIRFKPKTELRAVKIETLRRDLMDRQDRNSNQALLEYILELGFQKYLELEHRPQEELDQISDTR